MKIELKDVTIRELAEGYVDNLEEGVKAYGGKLDVRPAYQRDFVYKDAQRDAVIDSIRKNFPLNVMYWVDNEGLYEVLDGQQRTISICQFVKGYFSINDKNFENLERDQQEQILNYHLQVYVCRDGTDSEKLDWFHIINIAGEELSEQELRNANYRGPWLNAAKLHFSKRENPARAIGDKYIKAKWERQEGLETALSWIADKNKETIEGYMSKHQNEPNDNELWAYYQAVIAWVKMLFPDKYYREAMKGKNWGKLYNAYSGQNRDAEEIEKEVSKLMDDDDADNKSGIYDYIFDKQEKHLNIRDFDKSIKRKVYEKQKGLCKKCKEHFDFEQMQADHIKPWSKGGKTEISNCQLLCQKCNAEKSDKY
ncbi:MAG: DUF262 domain-containing protein [Elusimicrobiota bacterium]|nr:DUF262 domain-containing protein [Elusimicrobiota bacterium]